MKLSYCSSICFSPYPGNMEHETWNKSFYHSIFRIGNDKEFLFVIDEELFKKVELWQGDYAFKRLQLRFNFNCNSKQLPIKKKTRNLNKWTHSSRKSAKNQLERDVNLRRGPGAWVWPVFTISRLMLLSFSASLNLFSSLGVLFNNLDLENLLSTDAFFFEIFILDCSLLDKAMNSHSWASLIFLLQSGEASLLSKYLSFIFSTIQWINLMETAFAKHSCLPFGILMICLQLKDK